MPTETPDQSQIETPEATETPLPLDPIRQATVLDSARAERRALAVCTGLAVATIVWITRPVGIGILLGTLLAFSLQGFYERAVARTRRPAVTALAFVLASTIGLLCMIGGLASLLIARGIVLVEALIASLSPGGSLRAAAEKLSARLGPLQFKPDELAAKLRDAAADLASQAAGITRDVAGAMLGVLLTLFFMIMTLSFVLLRWKTLAARAEDLFPLRPRYTRAILAELHTVGRTTLLGTVVTGLAQGTFAAIGYWITGVPEPAFLGAATAVASLVPGVGTLLVWVPAGIFLIVTRHSAMGVVELCWGGLVVVGVSDYVIRPKLVGGHGTMPPLVMFAALFGGVEVFGLAGLIVGPLLMSISLSILRIFAKDSEERRARGERHA